MNPNFGASIQAFLFDQYQVILIQDSIQHARLFPTCNPGQRGRLMGPEHQRYSCRLQGVSAGNLLLLSKVLMISASLTRPSKSLTRFTESQTGTTQPSTLPDERGLLMEVDVLVRLTVPARPMPSVMFTRRTRRASRWLTVESP